jgi:hypothetical protein
MWAWKGDPQQRPLCWFHSRKYLKIASRVKKVTPLYEREAGAKLRGLIDQAKGVDDQHSLLEEIELSRALVMRNVTLFEKANFCEDPEKAKKISLELKAATCSNLKDSLTHLAALIEKDVKVGVLTGAYIHEKQVRTILTGVGKFVADCLLPDHKDAYDRITKYLDEIDVNRKPDTDGQPTVVIT